ncbi:BLUF domain-containing protein [Pseudozobellia thermophila]|uniref:Sensors of blue-light using FAD n=1 Tax=Pseudozobellia thermophila TaxID=192903 RepID=A0A1M6BB38_9FLAO|nr:BLUF domain-containing protein [Pseudozobellia thermophila]SHI45932.1 Sensors of blue-light using FAD [Pseudozobellia thermophila]
MFTIIYKSKAKADFTPNQILQMLKKANVHNKKHNITGCLLYHRGDFLQLIEGAEKDVRALYTVISKDPRHTEVNLLSAEKTLLRSFKDWNMVYNDLDYDSNDVEEKRRLFHEIFYGGEALSNPGRSKLVLWKEVNAILNEKKTSGL